MTSINIKNLTNLLIQPSKRFGIVEKLIREILILREKLKSPEKQTFYFRKGIKSQKDKLTELEEKYDGMRKILNSHSIDDFQEERIKAKKDLKKLLKKRILYTLDQFALAGINAKIKGSENFLDAKAKYKTLKPLDEYNIEELKQFFE